MADDNNDPMSQESIDKMRAAKPHWNAPPPGSGGPGTVEAQSVREKNAGVTGTKALHMRQKGGPVKAGESYIVGEKGPEKFVPSKSGRIVPMKKKHGFTHTHIELHDDGSATIHHQHTDPTKDVKHAAADLDGIHDSFQEHLNPEKAESEASKKGLDPEAMEEAVSPGIHEKVVKMAAGVEGE